MFTTVDSPLDLVKKLEPVIPGDILASWYNVIMSMWRDLYNIYQEVQEATPATAKNNAINGHPSSKPVSTQTMYVFAYLDNGKGKTVRDIPLQDRLSYLEMRQAHIEHRLAELEAKFEELNDLLEEDN